MKIAYIASSTIPSRTANSVHVMKMCQAFADNGHEVCLLIPDKTEKGMNSTEDVFDFYGVRKCFEIVRIPLLKTRIGLLVCAFRAVLKAKKMNPDLVYTRYLYSAFFSLLLGLPTVYEIHASFERIVEKIFFFLTNKKKLKKIVVISNSLRDYFIKKYKIDKEKIFVASDGADSVQPGIDLKKINKSDSEMTVGYVGNLYKGRGVDVIAELAKKCPWASFHLIGGLPKDVEFWKKKSSGMKNIVFYGHVPHKEVYGYMLAFNALIAPYQEKVSVYGGGNTAQWMSPLKIFEYMAAGKVILSSDLPVLKEVLEHKKNCLLAPPEDIEEWASNLELIKKDVALRKRLGENAKNDFEKKYTWRARADSILSSLNHASSKNLAN